MMDTLPLELICFIFSFVITCTNNKNAARLVCRKWRMWIDGMGCESLYRLPYQSKQEFARALAVLNPQHVFWTHKINDLDAEALSSFAASVTKLSLYNFLPSLFERPLHLTRLELIDMQVSLNLAVLEGIQELVVDGERNTSNDIFGTCSSITKLKVTNLCVDLRGLINLQYCVLYQASVCDVDLDILANLKTLDAKDTYFPHLYSDTFLDAFINIPILTYKPVDPVLFYRLMPQTMNAHTLSLSHVWIPDNWSLPNIQTLKLETVRANTQFDLASIPTCVNIELVDVRYIINTQALNPQCFLITAFDGINKEFSIMMSKFKNLRILVLDQSYSGYHCNDEETSIPNITLDDFKQLRQLEYLTIRGCYCNTLGYLPKLKKLVFDPLTHFVDILWDTMPELETADIRTDCNMFEFMDLSKLQRLSLVNNKTIKCLPRISSLHTLWLNNCYVCDLRTVTHVSKLFISNCYRITTLPTFVHLTLLSVERTSLNSLTSNIDAETIHLPYFNVTKMPTLKQITVLDIRYTQVVDLSFLSKAVYLTDLCIEDTLVHDLQPLSTLPALRIVNANYCSNIKDVTALRNVRKIYVSHCFDLLSIEPLLQPGASVWYLDVRGCSSVSTQELRRAAAIIPICKMEHRYVE
jgi:hypothetical protein